MCAPAGGGCSSAGQQSTSTRGENVRDVLSAAWKKVDWALELQNERKPRKEGPRCYEEKDQVFWI